jgi:ABC-2 type transport system ATP-binding protein
MDHGKIIALDTPDALVRQNFREQAIEFESQTPPPPIETLQRLAGVIRVQIQGAQITVFSTDVPATMAGLLNLSQQSILHYYNLVVRSATLEDVFLKLTGRRIRE